MSHCRHGNPLNLSCAECMADAKILDEGQNIPVALYLDDETKRRLVHAADAYGRTVQDLCQSLVEEGALDYAKKAGLVQ